MMKTILKNILVILVGLFVGSIVNGLLINIGAKIIAPPLGVDTKTVEGLKAGIYLFEIKHFIFPFLAHAIGTLVGSFIVAYFVSVHKFKAALFVGFLYFLGGAYMVYALPSPMWFNIVDLALAYIPFAYLGYKLAVKNKA